MEPERELPGGVNAARRGRRDISARRPPPLRATPACRTRSRESNVTTAHFAFRCPSDGDALTLETNRCSLSGEQQRTGHRPLPCVAVVADAGATIVNAMAAPISAPATRL